MVDMRRFRGIKVENGQSGNKNKIKIITGVFSQIIYGPQTNLFLCYF